MCSAMTDPLPTSPTAAGLARANVAREERATAAIGPRSRFRTVDMGRYAEYDSRARIHDAPEATWP